MAKLTNKQVKLLNSLFAKDVIDAYLSNKLDTHADIVEYITQLNDGVYDDSLIEEVVTIINIYEQLEIYIPSIISACLDNMKTLFNVYRLQPDGIIDILARRWCGYKDSAEEFMLAVENAIECTRY